MFGMTGGIWNDKVNTEKSSIGFIQCFLKNRSYARLRKIKKKQKPQAFVKIKKFSLNLKVNSG